MNTLAPKPANRLKTCAIHIKKAVFDRKSVQQSSKTTLKKQQNKKFFGSNENSCLAKYAKRNRLSFGEQPVQIVRV
ncbi:hypothetical protein [Mucilaginibacter terrenus]|uniref:hypothetical protein n=1 Tax=Mucilaginibacter terrenus TaxID=2482727 RepID=UPI0010587805|nr:hypothetical protein [Mucilaginibacter terrenus]